MASPLHEGLVDYQQWLNEENQCCTRSALECREFVAGPADMAVKTRESSA